MGTLYPEHLLNQREDKATWLFGLRFLLSSFLAHRYEVEINRRTAAENEFVVLKKVRERRASFSLLLFPSLSFSLLLTSSAQDFNPGLLGRGWCLNGDGVIVLVSSKLKKQGMHPGNGQSQTGENSGLGTGKLWFSSAFLCDLKKLTPPPWDFFFFSPGIAEIK